MVVERPLAPLLLMHMRYGFLKGWTSHSCPARTWLMDTEGVASSRPVGFTPNQMNQPVSRTANLSNPIAQAQSHINSGINIRRTRKTTRTLRLSIRSTPAERCRVGGRNSANPENANATPKKSILWGPLSTIPKYTHPRIQMSEKNEKTRPFRRPSGSRNNIRWTTSTRNDKFVLQ